VPEKTEKTYEGLKTTVEREEFREEAKKSYEGLKIDSLSLSSKLLFSDYTLEDTKKEAEIFKDLDAAEKKSNSMKKAAKSLKPGLERQNVEQDADKRINQLRRLKSAYLDMSIRDVLLMNKSIEQYSAIKGGSFFSPEEIMNRVGDNIPSSKKPVPGLEWELEPFNPQDYNKMLEKIKTEVKIFEDLSKSSNKEDQDLLNRYKGTNTEKVIKDFKSKREIISLLFAEPLKDLDKSISNNGRNKEDAIKMKALIDKIKENPFDNESKEVLREKALEIIGFPSTSLTSNYIAAQQKIKSLDLSLANVEKIQSATSNPKLSDPEKGYKETSVIKSRGGKGMGGIGS
jgi:hypothetical protein